MLTQYMLTQTDKEKTVAVISNNIYNSSNNFNIS
jgi:hypothetical protein